MTDLRGALAGRILADLGADVVRIERTRDDRDRRTPPLVAGTDASLPFLFRNLGKRGVVVDVDEAAGRARLAELCDRADVLIENVDGPERLRAFLEPAAVRARHPQLVHATIADLGRSGPRAGWRLEPLPAFAASGALWASGFPDRAPCWLPGWQAHDCASVVAVAGVLAALFGGAGGRLVEVSVQEAALASFAPWGIVLAEYAARLPILPATYPRDGDGPALVLPVADGFVRVLAVTPRQLRALAALVRGDGTREGAAAIGDGGAGASPVGAAFGPRAVDPASEKAERPASRVRGALERAVTTVAQEGVALASAVVRGLARVPLHADVLPAVHAALATFRLVATRALAGRRRDDVVAHGLRLGLPIAPVHRPEEFVAAEQTRVRGYFRRTGFPHVADAPVAPFPCVLSRTPVALRRPAPPPGEDGPGFAPRGTPAPSADARPARAVADAPLAGLRVVSLGVGAVVPELCAMLADLGADVVKVESGTSPDFLRRLSLDLASPNRSFMFNDENRGQRSVCLDLADARGRALALELCATADVVAENRQGGLVERLGLGYEAVRARRPDVIYVSSQGYGRGGPFGTAPAYGPLAAAFAGVTWLWNHADAPYPAGSSLEHPDHAAGKMLAVAVLAALDHRRRTGEGQSIELAQSEAAAFLVGDVYLQAACTGRPAAQMGNASPFACPHGVYPSRGKDAWIAVAVPDDGAWERCRAALRWPPDPRLAHAADRVHARDEIDGRLAAWTRARTAADAAALLQAAGVSAFPVESPDDQRADEHLRARDALVTIDDPEVGPVRHVRNPLRFDGAPLPSSRPAPRLGADTEDVLVRVLGLTPEAVRELVDAGVCA